LLDFLEVGVSNGTLEDESQLLSFSIHLGLEHASSSDDESLWIEPPDIAYPFLSVASIKTIACMIRTASLSRLVRHVVE
jgi:hypothetical protein